MSLQHINFLLQLHSSITCSRRPSAYKHFPTIDYHRFKTLVLKSLQSNFLKHDSFSFWNSTKVYFDHEWNENPSVTSRQQPPYWISPCAWVNWANFCLALPPKYTHRRQWANIGYKEYLLGEE